MATDLSEHETDPTDDLDEDADPSDEQPDEDVDAPDDDTADEDEDEDKPAEEDDRLVVNLGDEDETEDEDDEPPSADDAKRVARWNALKAEAKKAKALERELAEVKAKGATVAAPPAVKKPGPRPTLKDVDHDEEKLAQAILAHAKETEAYESEQKAAKDELAATYAAYDAKRAKVGHPKFKEYEAAVDAALAKQPWMVGIFMKKTTDTANLVVGLGQNPAKLAKLTAISDPVDFAFALRDLEKSKHVIDKRKPPQEESVVRGGSGPSHDATLKRLEAEADRTGNRAPIHRYLREQTQKRQKKK